MRLSSMQSTLVPSRHVEEMNHVTWAHTLEKQQLQLSIRALEEEKQNMQLSIGALGEVCCPAVRWVG